MKKTTLAITLVLLILFSIVAGILLVDWEGTEEEPEEIVDKLYTFPLSIGKKPTLLLLEAIGPLRQRLVTLDY